LAPMPRPTRSTTVGVNPGLAPKPRIAWRRSLQIDSTTAETRPASESFRESAEVSMRRG
jgi:hypothetical protein